MAKDKMEKTEKKDKENTVEMNRAQALERAMAESAKAGIKMFTFGSKSAQEIMPAIPTNIVSLDKALGIGGIPKGRIIELYGSESGGKCLPADTYILTANNGFRQIKDMFEDNGEMASCTDKVCLTKIPLINKNGDVEETEALVCNGRRPVVKMTTASGATIRSTKNHPHLIMSKEGYLIWEKTQNLQVGDYLSISRKEYFGNVHRDEDEMYLLGCLIADGCFVEKGIMISNNDKYILDLFDSKFCDIFKFPHCRKYPKGDVGHVDYHYNSKESVANFYKKYGLKRGIAKDKIVPAMIYCLDKSSIANFLMGYIDCECSIDESGIEVCSASKELLAGVRRLLLQFGIISYIRSKHVNGYDQEYWKLYITGKEFVAYLDNIGFRSSVRREQINKLVINRDESTNIDSIPYLGKQLEVLYKSSETTRKEYKLMGDYMGDNPCARLTYNRLDKILENIESDNPILYNLRYLKHMNYFYDPIVSIKDDGEEPTFDVVMPKTHSFIADGIVTHNTSLSLHIAAQVQKKGGVVVYIDAEHALDPAYAAKLGVDLDKMLIFQSDSGDQAFEATEKMVSSGSVDLVVIDSVAALVPKAEIEGEMADSHMGLQARMMGQGLRKITGLCAKMGTTVIFINQIRQTMAMYGPKDTTPGGLALRFFASLRMDVRGIENIKKGDKIVGKMVRVKMIKNKTSAPYTSAEFYLPAGQGPDIYKDLIDYSVDKGIIIKAGTWLSYKEENIGQGVEGATETLKANPELFEKIKAEAMSK